MTVNSKRKVITATSKRRAAAVWSVLVASTAAAVVYLVMAVLWPATPKMTTTFAWSMTGTVALSAAIVVAILLHRSPKPLVPRIKTKGMDKTERRLAHRLHRYWFKACRDSGIAREDLEPDAVTIQVPRIVSIERVPLGLRLIVQAVPGQPANDLAKHADNIASALGVWFRCKVIGPSTCEVVAELHDPLDGIRHAGTSISTEIVVGRCDDGTDAIIDLAESSHLAIQGMTRSGKSAVCYTAIGQFVASDSVRISGIDPNRVLLQPLAEALGAEDFVLGFDATAALALLDRTCAVLDRRLALLTEWGIAEMKDFGPDLRVRVLILEEYASLIRSANAHDEGLKPAERVAPKIKQRVARLVSEGAKAGIRVMLITQRMDASIVDGDSRAQFGTRITMGVDNADAVRMLHPQATPEAVEKVTAFPPGRCLFWRHRVEKFMQADFTEYAEYRARLGLSPAPESDPTPIPNEIK